MPEFEVGDFVYWRRNQDYLKGEITKIEKSGDSEFDHKTFYFEGTADVGSLSESDQTTLRFEEGSRVYYEAINLKKSKLAKLLYGIKDGKI